MECEDEDRNVPVEHVGDHLNFGFRRRDLFSTRAFRLTSSE